MLNQQHVIDYITNNPGKTSREIAKHFGVPKKVLNRSSRDWPGIYRLPGIIHVDWKHYPETQAVPLEEVDLTGAVEGQVPHAGAGAGAGAGEQAPHASARTIRKVVIKRRPYKVKPVKVDASPPRSCAVQSLTVGTDCSGIEAPIMALKNLGIPFVHKFSSDIYSQCRAFIQKHFHPEKIYADVNDRHIDDVPAVDLYIAGFPCQPFSVAGCRRGFEDTRGTIFFKCFEYIQKKQPRMFILENVKGIVNHDKKKTFQTILTKLNSLNYHVQWKILNTKHFGIPQNRERLFFVGTRDDLKVDFTFPEPAKTCPPVSKFLETDADEKKLSEREAGNLKKAYEKWGRSDLERKFYFLNLAAGNATWISRGDGTNARCICAKDSKFFITHKSYQRLLTLNEAFRLQGMDPTRFDLRDFSNTAKWKFVGNTISVNVIQPILQNLLTT